MSRCCRWLYPASTLIVLVTLAIGCATTVSRPQASAAPHTEARLPAALSGGLARVNWYRAMVGLPPLVYDPAHDRADFKHARYVIKNNIQAVDFDADREGFDATGRQFGASHEKPGNPWFSNDGANAAYRSWTAAGSRIPGDYSGLVDAAMSSPFNALIMLNPQASTISAGQFCETGRCAVTISYDLGLDLRSYTLLYAAGADVRGWNPALGKLPFTSGHLLKPIEFPPPDSSVPRIVSDGRGWPNPLSACPGYKAPIGQPIILELGQGTGARGVVTVNSHSITVGGKGLEHCLLDSATYHNPDQRQSEWGRNFLRNLGAVILVPREPLQAGVQYSVSISADSTAYAWSFTLARAASPRKSSGDVADSRPADKNLAAAP
jgi:uncharacterized protein YkwD